MANAARGAASGGVYAIGVLALIAGVWTRLAAGLTLFMVANFQFARGQYYQWDFLIDGAGLPVLGGLLVLAVGRWAPMPPPPSRFSRPAPTRRSGAAAALPDTGGRLRPAGHRPPLVLCRVRGE